MILGLDWLSSFSPMQIHWQQKWIAIPYDGATVVLIGDALDLPVGSVLQLSMVQSDSSGQSITSKSLPPEFKALLTEFAHLFQPPNELPPQRDCDHSIPGAQLVFIRPYRYAPVLKNEIECQVAEMLEQGIIFRRVPVPSRHRSYCSRRRTTPGAFASIIATSTQSLSKGNTSPNH